MLNYTSLNSQQKNRVETILKMFLHRLHLSPYYRVEQTENSLRLRTSTQNPPEQRHKARLEMLLQLFMTQEFMQVEKIRTAALAPIARGAYGAVAITLYRVTQVSPILFQNLRASNNCPDDIREELWAAMDLEIKQGWSHFSDALKTHIKTSLNANLQERYDNLLTTQVLGDTFRSPVGLSITAIPVRLPNARLESGASNEVYDLVEVLKFPRDHNGHFRNPITRDTHRLIDIIPAPESTAELIRRLAAAEVPQREPAVPTMHDDKVIKDVAKPIINNRYR